MSFTLKSFLGKWGLSIAMLLVIIGTFSYGFYKRWKAQHDSSMAFLELRPIQVKNGWGYDILQNGHPWCHQDYIPAVTGYRVFRTKEDALAAGQIVYDKAISGKMPDITEEEMRKKGIFIPPPDSTVKDTTANKVK